MEFLRVSTSVGGHSWWLFQDILGASNGLVDYMFRPKGGALAADQIRHFVDPVVILVSNGTLWQLDEQSAVYASGDTIRPQLVVSNYFPSALSGCNLSWSAGLVEKPAAPFAKGRVAGASVGQGTVSAVGAALEISLPAVLQPSRWNLSVTMDCAELERPRVNNWQAWIYPPAAPIPSGSSIFVSPSIEQKVKVIAPAAKPLPATLSSSSDAVYVLSQSDLVRSPAGVVEQLLADVEDGSTLLIPEVVECTARGGCDGRKGCVPPACNATAMAELVPFNLMEPLLFHSPWWTNDAVTPTALLTNKATKNRTKNPLFWSCWPDCGKEVQAEAEAAPSVAEKHSKMPLPAGLAAMSNADGRVDDGWFGGFGPVPSACAGRVRSAVAFKGGSMPVPWKPDWPCPEAYPFPSIHYAGLCYNESSYAHAMGGPCKSWCTDDPKKLAACGSICKLPVPNVTVCPTAFPYNSSNPELCYSTKTAAAAGSGPCDSWCTKRVWPGCMCDCGCGCGDPSKKLCSASPPGPPKPPPPPPMSFVQQLAHLNGSLWLSAIFGNNFASSSCGAGSKPNSPLAGVIWTVPKGKGRIIVSGVDIDLTCNATDNPHKLFDENLLRALLDAAVGTDASV